MAETIRFGVGLTAGASDTVKQTSAAIAAGAAVLDPVFFDEITSKWTKATLFTPTPTAIVESVVSGVGTIVLSEALVGTGLIAGRFYFMAAVGGISTVHSDTLVGQAKSTTELLVNFKSERTVTPITQGYWAHGGATSIDKITLSTEAVTLVGATFSENSSQQSAGGSRNNAYKTKGISPTNLDKFIFSSDTTAVLVGVLPLQIRESTVWPSDINLAIYTANAGAAVGTSINRLSAVSETQALIAAVTVKDEVGAGGFTSLEKGYSATENLQTDRIGSLKYSTETTALLVTTLSVVSVDVNTQGDNSRSSNRAGYIALSGGTVMNKFNFTSDLITNLGAIRNTSYVNSSSMVNAMSKMYITGLTASANTLIDGFNTETDTAFVFSNVLTVATTSKVGFNN